ncbi:MAG: tRNA pseudouridine(55) synthase TruB [Saprospiraceae bacterium]
MNDNDFQSGKVLLIDKPLLWTSFDVVNKLRYSIKHKTGLKKIKVGHAGTLDPMATGLLIICTGKFTPRINEFQDQEKEYTGTFTLGATRPSFDMETEIDETFPTEHITAATIEQARHTFLGAQSQFPPIFSAIKMDGKPIYKAARRGELVEVKAREINIKEFEITGVEMPSVHFRVKCSKGTYLRSLAHDFGKSVKSGAYLSALRRTKIGDHDVANALSVEEFLEKMKDIPDHITTLSA